MLKKNIKWLYNIQHFTMNQKYKFFVNNKVVYLTNNPSNVDNLVGNADFIIEPYKDEQSLATSLKIIFNDLNTSNYILFHKNVEKLKEDFLAHFICLEAAGGVVYNAKNEILLIHRRGFWDLPKGKMEEGETIEETAVREVEEETGLVNVHILKPVLFKAVTNTATYHSYILNGKQAMKISYWFEMKTEFATELIPQQEEDIEQAIWVKKEAIPDYFDNMYSSIIDVLKEVL